MVDSDQSVVQLRAAAAAIDYRCRTDIAETRDRSICHVDHDVVKATKRPFSFTDNNIDHC